MYTADLVFFFLDGEQFVITRKVSLHKSRYTSVLFQDFGILHVLQMLGYVCFCFRTQKARHWHCLGRDFDGAIILHYYFRCFPDRPILTEHRRGNQQPQTSQRQQHK